VREEVEDRLVIARQLDLDDIAYLFAHRHELVADAQQGRDLRGAYAQHAGREQRPHPQP